MLSVACRSLKHHPGPIPNWQERRASGQAVDYWAALCPDDHPPTIADFMPPAENELGRHYFLLKADPIAELSMFILCGDGVRADIGGEPVGKPLQDPFPEPIGGRFGRACAYALERQEPVYEDGAFTTGDGAECLYRSVFMPINSAHAFDTGYVFGAFRSKRSETSPSRLS
jgi:hypothetical protein